MSRQTHSAKRAAERELLRRGKPRARLHESGYWLVPMDDSRLDLLGGDWSPPVQLRVVRDGDGYELRVRDARAATL